MRKDTATMANPRPRDQTHVLIEAVDRPTDDDVIRETDEKRYCYHGKPQTWGSNTCTYRGSRQTNR